MPAVAQLCLTVEELKNSDQIVVPLLPEIAQKAMKLAQDPDSDAQELAKLIQSDQPLAAHVMRIANSASYSPQGNIVSLQQAISRLGMNLIAQITLAASMNAITFNAPGFEKDLANIKDHALASALWGKEIARKIRKNVEAAFIGGLLNTIGQPAIIQALVKQNPNCNHDDVMLAAQNCYAAVTKHILEEWQMPKIVVDSVCASATNELAAITTMAHAFTDGFNVLLSSQHICQMPSLEIINLYPEDIDDLRDKIEVVQASLDAMR